MTRAIALIATLWSIYDVSAPDIAADVYATLAAGNTSEADRSAHALHHAVTTARAKHPPNPWLGRPICTSAHDGRPVDRLPEHKRDHAAVVNGLTPLYRFLDLGYPTVSLISLALPAPRQRTAIKIIDHMLMAGRFVADSSRISWVR
jgi:hypothetical protein